MCACRCRGHVWSWREEVIVKSKRMFLLHVGPTSLPLDFVSFALLKPTPPSAPLPHHHHHLHLVLAIPSCPQMASSL